jgi:phage terminase large subunit-like protein
MAKASLYYFCKYILHFSDMATQPHWELCQFLQKWGFTNDCLILLPRGTFKSSVTSVGFPIWRLLRNRSLRFLLTSGQLENTKNFLSLIRSNLESNEDFRVLFGDWSTNRRNDTWHSTALSVAGREKFRAEDTLTASSYEITKVSQHYDTVIVDDLMNEKNVTTREQIDKCDSYLQLMNPFLDPQIDRPDRPGPRIVVGTRWHFDDVYGRIISRELKRRRDGQGTGWHMLIRPAYNKIKTQVYFPSRFSIPYLERLRKDSGMSRYHFSCQYLNDPMPDEDQTFKSSDMGFFWAEPDGYGECVMRGKLTQFPRLLAHFCILDPAATDHAASDWSAIVVVGVDTASNLYVLDVRRGQWGTQQIVDEMIRAQQDYRPYRFGVESVTFQRTLVWAFNEVCKARGMWFPVEELHTDNQKSKQQRIHGFSPFVVTHKVFLRLPMRCDLTLPTEVLYPALDGGMAILGDEMLRFPLGANDDCLDALAYSPQLVFPPTETAVSRSPGGRTFDGLQKRLRRQREGKVLTLR